jgi:predicted GNAT family acetyltransferase
MSGAKTFAHEPDAKRYAMYVDGALVSVADYAISGNAISFTHTFTNPAHRGKGLAAELVEFAMNDVESTSTRRVLPMCWYVGDWFQEHPERAELLSR